MDALASVADWPVETAAVGVVTIDRTGGPATAAGLGSIGPEDRGFPWASVTKPATALAVLVAIEEGTLSLDDPAGPPGRPSGISWPTPPAWVPSPAHRRPRRGSAASTRTSGT